jgi:hypothetical protein
MDLLAELLKIPESTHDLEIFFRVKHATGNIKHVDAVTTEIFKFQEDSDDIDVNAFHQVVNLRSMDFVENTYAHSLGRTDRFVEQKSLLHVGELIKLLQLSINVDIPVIAYNFMFNSESAFNEITTLEKDQSSFFGCLSDCYILS